MNTSPCFQCSPIFDALNNKLKLLQREIQNLTYINYYKDLSMKKNSSMILKYNEENKILKSLLRKSEKSKNSIFPSPNRTFSTYPNFSIKEYKKNSEENRAMFDSEMSPNGIDRFSKKNVDIISFGNLADNKLKIKHLIKSIQTISKNIELSSLVKTIEDEVSKILECEKVFLFLYHENSKDFYKPLYDDKISIEKRKFLIKVFESTIIRINEIQKNNYVFKKEHEENTFSFEKIKDLIYVHLVDNDKNIGIIKCINKKIGSFSIEDESLLRILSKQSTIILKNCNLYEKTMVFKHNLLKLIDIGISLFQCLKLDKMINLAEQHLQEIMSSKDSRIFLINENNELVKYNKDNTIISLCKIEVGIIGQCIKYGNIIKINNPYKNSYFNSLVDIETNLTSITVPIKNNEGKILGVFQVIDLKGFVSEKTMKKNSDSEDQILLFFTKILGICIEKLEKIDLILNKNENNENPNKNFKNKSKTTMNDYNNLNTSELE